MKMRQGFVSNSSSSSFVVTGWELPKDEAYKILGFEQDEDGDWPDEIYECDKIAISLDDSVIIGSFLIDIDVDHIGIHGELGLDEVTYMLQKTECMNLGLGRPKLIAGTQRC